MVPDTVQIIVQVVVLGLLAFMGIPMIWTALLHGDIFYPEVSPFEGILGPLFKGWWPDP